MSSRGPRKGRPRCGRDGRPESAPRGLEIGALDSLQHADWLTLDRPRSHRHDDDPSRSEVAVRLNRGLPVERAGVVLPAVHHHCEGHVEVGLAVVVAAEGVGFADEAV